MHSFEIYGKWSVQASKQTYTHTHVRNAVTLVWGSLSNNTDAWGWGIMVT